MSFVEARLSLQLLAEEEIGAPIEAAAEAKKAAEDTAWARATR